MNTELERCSRVLVVDDDEVNRKVAGLMLQHLGCAVVLATNGREALDVIETHALDIVFMDCRMPEMDGYDAAREVRRREAVENRARLPIVALTANALEGDRNDCLDAGMDDFVSKPFSRHDLKRSLTRWISARAAVAEDPALAEPAPPALDEVLDLAIVDRLRALRRPGRDGVFAKAVAIWTASSAADIVKLTDAVRSSDLEEARRIAHRIRGSTSTLGGRRLAKLLGIVEEHACSGALSSAMALIDDVTAAHRTTRHALHAAASSTRRDA